MKEQLEQLSLTLSHAGCGESAIEKAEMLMKAGQTADLIRYLRLCRCQRMDELHRIQKQVDCMDYLIRQTEKRLR